MMMRMTRMMMMMMSPCPLVDDRFSHWLVLVMMRVRMMMRRRMISVP
jgi:hypothetical protein